MPRAFLRSISTLVLTGCVAASPPAEAPASLAGNYRVVAVDGRAPSFVEEDAGKPRTPRFAFGARSYGGTSGCNFMGGLKAERGGRLYTSPGAQTQMACGGALGAQEAAIDALFRASPTIRRDGEAVILSGAGHPAPGPRRRATRGARCAGSVARHASLRAALRNASDRWRSAQSPTGAVAEFRGLDRHPDERLRQACRRNVPASAGHVAHGVQAEARMRDLGRFAGTLSTVSGPNGELLLAGDGHWLAGDNLRRDRPK
ncbi:MAG TPA: META domain-containing protein [Novosphingobium sp.]|nr:META domain-containing protein [Novosphingobium sp.]